MHGGVRRAAEEESPVMTREDAILLIRDCYSKQTGHILPAERMDESAPAARHYAWIIEAVGRAYAEGYCEGSAVRPRELGEKAVGRG